MHKLIALYRRPEDTEQFDKLYRETHLPLVMQMPNLRGVELNRVTGAPGSEPEYYLVAELLFDTREEMMEGISSDASRQAAKALNTFARGLVTMVFAQSEDAVERGE